MTKFKSLRMAASLAADPRISIRKTCLGLSQTAVYTPTESKLEAIQNDYAGEWSDTLKRLIACPKDRLEQFTKSTGSIEKAPMGPVRLEGCLSLDRQFAALQLFGYSDFEYHPTTDVRTFEGWEAELISTIL